MLALALILATALTTAAFAAMEDTGFSDVDADAWYAGAVKWCRENEIMNGVGGADLYEIIPAQPYTSDDLNYNTDCRTNREQNDASARPSISGIGSSAANLHSLASAATWMDGRRFSGNASESAVAEWVNGLDLGR